METPILSVGEQELLAVLRHRLRLPILIELERRGELNAPLLRDLLADEFGATYNAIYFALDQLAAAGLIVKTRTDPGTQLTWFRVASSGWVAFRKTLAAQVAN